VTPDILGDSKVNAPPISEMDPVAGLTNLWRQWDRYNISTNTAEPPVAHWNRQVAQPNNDLNGQRVVVISADTREIIPMQEIPLDKRGENHVTFSAIYNLWWAVRHGYDYRRIKTEAPDGYYPTWGKVKAIYDMLHRYDFVVFCDTDVFFARPHLGLGDLMKRWGFHERASILISKDKNNGLPIGKNGTNAGFMVIRSTPLSKQIFRRMIYCSRGEVPPGDDKGFPGVDFSGCTRFKTEFFQEQTVLNNFFLRKALIENEHYVVSPCNESTGFWQDDECKGLFVTHAWYGKNLIYEKMQQLFLDHHLHLYESLLWSGYHKSKCSKWTPQDERCAFPE
jgi:hypothetical protein